MLNGRLTAADYEDDVAADPRIDQLRSLMHLAENECYTEAYRDPARKWNPNSIQVFFKDGSSTPLIEVLQPIGAPARRAEGIPMVIDKFERNVARRFARKQKERILQQCLDHAMLLDMPVPAFTDMLAV